MTEQGDQHELTDAEVARELLRIEQAREVRHERRVRLWRAVGIALAAVLVVAAIAVPLAVKAHRDSETRQRMLDYQCQWLIEDGVRQEGLSIYDCIDSD